MKPLKYIIFLSVLSGIFLIVYRNSDRKGLGRYSSTDKNSVEILAESNKSEETKVIKNLLKNYE